MLRSLVMKQELIEAALDQTRPGWRERRDRRKSPWNLVGVMLAFAIAGIAWYALFKAAWRLHVLVHPAHADQLKNFWGKGISIAAFIPSFLMLMPLALPAFTSGLILSSCILWCIPPARRAMNSEAAGDPEMTFVGANRDLLKWGGLASAVCITMSAIGAVALQSLR